MVNISKKRKHSTDGSELKCTPDSKKQKLPDFTEIEFKVMLKNAATAFEGEHLSDIRWVWDS